MIKPILLLLVCFLIIGGSLAQDAGFIVGSPSNATLDQDTGVTTYSDAGGILTTNIASITFVENTLDNTQKLPLHVEGRTINDRVGIVTNLVYSVSPLTAGTFEVPADTTGAIQSYFVPADDYVGIATITSTGENKLGATISGSFAVQVLAGPALTINIQGLAPVDK